MATITPTASYSDRQITWTWANAATADTIVAVEIEHNPSDLLVEATANTAGGATVTFSGSLDNSAFNATSLVDLSGTAVSFTATGAGTIRDAWRYIKPALSGGTGDDWTIKLMARIAA